MDINLKTNAIDGETVKSRDWRSKKFYKTK